MKHQLKSIIVTLLTNTFGKTLVLLRPEKAKQLSKEGMTLVLNNNMTFSERLMRHAILKNLEAKKDHDTLAELHQNYWTNKGASFFSDTEDRFENEFLPSWTFIFDILKVELSNSSEEFHTLVEIGTGNGNVLNYLSGQFPNIKHFVGIDLSPDQIKINNEKFKNNPRLAFSASDGFDWVNTHGQEHTIFVTSGGVLEYFTEPRLEEFLQKINSLGKSMCIAIEPNGTSHDFEVNPHSELYGHERSFSHNYTRLFKNAGFDLWHHSQKHRPEISQILTFIGAKN